MANINTFRWNYSIAHKIYDFVKRADPRFVEGCPHKTLYWNFTAFDVNEIIGGILPDIVPAGNELQFLMHS